MHNHIYTLDTTTGAATLVGYMGGPQIGGMVSEKGILYGGQNYPDLRVDMLDPVTGVATPGPAITGLVSGICTGLAPVLGSTSSCDTPTSLSTSNVTGTSATLRWDAVSGAVEYEVGYKVVGASRFTIVHATGNSTTLGGLTPLTQYVWRVRTVCSLSPPLKSAYSGLVQFTTTNGCDIPTGLFSEPRATSAFLAWDTVDGAISYEIMYQVARDPVWATVRARGSFITLRGLTPRTTYYWKVKTICSDSPPVSSEYSAQESFFTFPR